MNYLLNAVNAFVDRITNRSITNIARQFRRTQSRLQALRARRVQQIEGLDVRIDALSGERDELLSEVFRAERIASRIDGLLE